MTWRTFLMPSFCYPAEMNALKNRISRNFLTLAVAFTIVVGKHMFFGFTLHFCPLQAVKCRRNFLPLVYAAFGIVCQTFPVLNEISTGGFLQNKRSLLFFAINFDSFPARSCISARALPPLPLPAHMFACNVWHDQ